VRVERAVVVVIAFYVPARRGRRTGGLTLTSDFVSFRPAVRPPSVKIAIAITMAELYPSIAQCAVVATALKVLLFPA
jgi:hypothetical protein